MNEFEFTEEEFYFLDMLKNSSLYQKLHALSHEISLDESLSLLAEERDAFLAKADKEEDEAKRHELLVQFKEKDDQLKETPLMKEYLATYQKLRKILVHLSDALTKEIKE